jgi:glutaminyl-peptide cyclotransferase
VKLCAFRISVALLVAVLTISGGSLLQAQSFKPADTVQGSRELEAENRKCSTAESSPRNHSTVQYKIVNIYPHDSYAFTEGLVYDHGFLYESTGLNGRSTIRKVELQTGKVLKSYSLPYSFFGEGLAQWQGTLIQLTWRSGTAFVYDTETFAKQKELTYRGEGWGITGDGTSLIMSDGSSILRFMNPATFVEDRRIEVRDREPPVSYLNELEYVNGEVLANIWCKDLVARISPETGEVLDWIDLSGLRDELSVVQRVDVLNGIAYDEEHNRLFVTGKLWPKLFEIELFPSDAWERPAEKP